MITLSSPSSFHILAFDLLIVPYMFASPYLMPTIREGTTNVLAQSSNLHHAENPNKRSALPTDDCLNAFKRPWLPSSAAMDFGTAIASPIPDYFATSDSLFELPGSPNGHQAEFSWAELLGEPVAFTVGSDNPLPSLIEQVSDHAESGTWNGKTSYPISHTSSSALNRGLYLCTLWPHNLDNSANIVAEAELGVHRHGAFETQDSLANELQALVNSAANHRRFSPCSSPSKSANTVSPYVGYEVQMPIAPWSEIPGRNQVTQYESNAHITATGQVNHDVAWHHVLTATPIHLKVGESSKPEGTSNANYESSLSNIRSFTLDVGEANPPLNERKIGYIIGLNSGILQAYASRFQQMLKVQAEKCQSLHKSKIIPFTGITVVGQVPRDFGIKSLFIRPLNLEQDLVGPAKFKDCLDSLIQWILILHQIWYDHIEPPPRMGFASHADLLSWFYNEFFGISGHTMSLPVFGEASRAIEFYDERDFGPVQKILIQYYSAIDTGKIGLKTAAAIIGIWYKNTDLEWWETNFAVEQLYWEFMRQASELAHKTRVPVEKPREFETSCELKSIGNFEIFDLRTFAPALPSEIRNIIIPPSTLGVTDQVKRKIINMMNEIYNQHLVGARSKKIEFENLQIAAIEPRNYRAKMVKLLIIRLLNSQGRPTDVNKVKRKMTILLESLFKFNVIFLSFVASKQEKLRQEGNPGFLSWFNKQLFGSDNHLPIIGTIPTDEIFSGKRLNELQVFLVECLTKFTLNSETDEQYQIAISILGYWCKNNCGKFWGKNFNSDKDYWQFAIEATKHFIKFFHAKE